MTKSVVREFHWTPDFVDLLYIDDRDIHGLIYWYNDIVEMNKELNKK
jgi:hypothetical protein